MDGPATPGGVGETTVSLGGSAAAEAHVPSAVVTVRYWAAIKAAAGVAQEQVTAATVAGVLEEVRVRHRDSARFSAVLDMCSVLVDEQPSGSRDPAETLVRDGAVVDLLPPFAGG